LQWWQTGNGRVATTRTFRQDGLAAAIEQVPSYCQDGVTTLRPQQSPWRPGADVGEREECDREARDSGLALRRASRSSPLRRIWIGAVAVALADLAGRAVDEVLDTVATSGLTGSSRGLPLGVERLGDPLSALSSIGPAVAVWHGVNRLLA